MAQTNGVQGAAGCIPVGGGAVFGIRRQGLSLRLPLCFPAGSECTTSCLDHNNESIVLPANVTVRDIPHWLNPTRVQVSDWEENDLIDHLHALVLSWSLSIWESI